MHPLISHLLGPTMLCLSVSCATLMADATAPDRVERAPGEVLADKSRPCFEGAYYRKAVSSQDHWTGITGIVTLPQIDFDPTRVHPETGKKLDNPSVYMGGRAGEQEIDAGVSYEVIREPDGSVSKTKKAFRPFWRNADWHSGPAQPQYYYYPGDTLRMSCVIEKAGTLRLTIDLLARAGDELNLAAEPISTLSVAFDGASFTPDGVQEFKRVNAIDLVGNEGKAVATTATRIEQSTWHETYLLRGETKWPLVAGRYTDMRCPDPDHIRVTASDHAANGGEVIDLLGTP